MTSLFEPLDGGRVLPTGHSRGPWDPDALHGGPVAMLVAGAVEALPTDHPMTVSRLTIELERPVPLVPLTVRAEVTRPGRKVRVVDAEVHTDDGTRIVRARALQIRTTEVDLDSHASAVELAPPPTGPEGLPAAPPSWRGPDEAFHLTAAEHRYVSGSFERLGPVAVWISVVIDVLPGQRPSPLQQVAGAGDFGNGVSAIVPFDEYLFINPDLTIHLDRPPTDDWVLLHARTHLDRAGTGLAESELFDRRGHLGRSLQSLLLEAR